MKIALFLPSDTAFYRTLLASMLNGFRQHENIEVYGGAGLLKEAELLKFCKAYQPDVVFEMNRSRNMIPELPQNIVHVSWLVDHGPHPINYYQGSEIQYLFGSQWPAHYQAESSDIVAWLPPGTDPDIYYPGSHPPDREFSFIGHIPLPWSETDRARSVTINGIPKIQFGEIIDRMNAVVSGMDADQISEIGRHINNPEENVLYQSTEIDVRAIDDAAMRYDLLVKFKRIFNRTRMLDCIVPLSDSIDFFGPENWQSWPAYKDYYRGFISDPNQLRSAYQNSVFSLHEGNGAHFRAYDSMASGSVLLFHDLTRDASINSLNVHFEPGEHYLNFTGDNIHEIIGRHRKNPKQTSRLAGNAARLVAQKHSWYNRAETILADIFAVI